MHRSGAMIYNAENLMGTRDPFPPYRIGRSREMSPSLAELAATVALSHFYSCENSPNLHRISLPVLPTSLVGHRLAVFVFINLAGCFLKR